MSVPLTSEQRSLVERNLRLAYRFANDYTRRHRVRYRDDIVSAALEGLTIAAKKYDPARAKFSTYARWWMRARVHHAVVKSFVVHIPAPAFAVGSKFADFRDRAASCGEVTDQIPARADRLEDLGEVLDALEALPGRSRYVLEQIFVAGRTYAEVGAELKISQTRAGQIARAAIERLRAIFEVTS